MTIVHRIEVSYKKDARLKSRTARMRALGRDAGLDISEAKLVEVYTISTSTTSTAFSMAQLKKLCKSLTNPLTQRFTIDTPTMCDFDFAIEIGFLPGVTDNVGNTVKQMTEDLLGVKFQQDEAVYSSQLFLFKTSNGKISKEATTTLSKDTVKAFGEALANPLIQRIHIKTRGEYGEAGMGVVVPQVKLNETLDVETVNLDVDDEELARIGKEGILDKKTGHRRGPLALDVESLKAIRAYFKGNGQSRGSAGGHEGGGRQPTDIELESLAQTWSEHCKHTIFAAALDDDLPEGLYKTYIKAATNKIRQARKEMAEKRTQLGESNGNNNGNKCDGECVGDICVSVFTDNSGAIEYDDQHIVTHKVETHNSPSALDPFGGAITGIVGVNRDTIGFGLGAKPAINYYGYCFADPDSHPKLYRGKNKSNPILSPRRILEGVIAGVNAGGNCSGIPTPQGWCYFDDRYCGKPLVFVGTVGIMPKETKERSEDGKDGDGNNGRKLYLKSAKPGDRIVVVGGRVGKDGIHGATFSSEALDSGSPATAVQIGDPITQKKLSDAIVKEARDLNLYNSITDNGAGGISCSVAEMAKECNGCHVDLEKVPLKYPGMSPWEIWISESQERMTLAVPPEKAESFMELMARRGVEATVIGEFNNSGKCVVDYHGKTIMDIELDFLHDGVPEKKLRTIYTPGKYEHQDPKIRAPRNLNKTLLEMLARKNICSKEFISTQYDHAVQGGQVIGPLQGKGRVQGTASLTKLVLGSKKAVGLSQGVYPAYSDIDTYDMAAAGIDMAIRGLIAIGIPLEKIALLDNFCWCSSNEPERLGQLKRAAKACYDYSTAFGTPFISGKDSMFNDFKGFDGDGDPVKISIPPTLLISSIGVLDDAEKAVTMDAKIDGDLVYVVGETKPEEMGASEYFASKGAIGKNVPKLDAARAMGTYKRMGNVISEGLVASAHPVNHGGLGVALAKVAIAGELGMEILIPETEIPSGPSEGSRADYYLFSESQGRFVVTIDPKNRDMFERLMAGNILLLGRVVKDQSPAGINTFVIKSGNHTIVNLQVQKMEKTYKSTFRGY